MKTTFKTVIAIALLSGLFLTVSCKGKSEENGETTTEQTAEQGKEYTSAYVCPMHCEGSGSDKEGTCPTCGMDYVALADHTGDGHEH